MQCTPESNIYLKNSKGQRCYDDCADSGYSGLFQSPQTTSGAGSCSSLSPVEFNETSKENLSVTPKARMKDSAGSLDKEFRGTRQQSAISWFETPKVYKRDASLRHRLLMSKPFTDVQTDNPKSPCTRNTGSSLSTSSEHWLSVSFESLEALASSTLGLEHNQPLSGRKRRILFSQVRTSTLEDGKVNCIHLPNFEGRDSVSEADFSESISASNQSNIKTPHFSKFLPASSKEDSRSPVSGATNSLDDCSSVLCTPSYTHTPKYIRYLLILMFVLFSKCSCEF